MKTNFRAGATTAVLGFVAFLFLVAPSHAAELTVVSPTGTLHLGETLTIKATGFQARSILSEVAKGAANRKLTLFLGGIEIPIVHASYRVSEETARLQAELATTSERVVKAEREAKEAQARTDDPKITDPAKGPDATKKIKAAADLKEAAEQAQKLFEGKAEVHVSLIVDRNSEDETSRHAWDSLLRHQRKFTSVLDVALAVGTQSPVPVEGPEAKTKVTFVVSNHIGLGIAAGILCLFICVLILVCKSNMLREAGNPENAFSLSLVQMAFWGVLVLSCFVGVVMTCHSLEHIPAQTLVLLGISATTGLTAAIIGTGATPAPKSVNSNRAVAFFEDICIGNQGASFYRVQVVLWTIVLGGFFIWNVLQMVSMPEFSSTLLMLMGISNGTYLGFKTREN